MKQAAGTARYIFTDETRPLQRSSVAGKTTLTGSEREYIDGTAAGSHELDDQSMRAHRFDGNKRDR